MAITRNADRQWPLVAIAEFTYDDFGASGVAENAIKLPPDAVITGLSLGITTVFNSATSDVIDVVAGGEGIAAADADAAVDLFEATLTGGQWTTAETWVTVEWTGVGAAPTTGAGYVRVEYIVRDRGTEVYAR